jgi:DNA-binding NarL/FixJ family response regulator
MKPLRILLADDHKVVRQGFRALLERERDFKIVGEADNGLEAIRLVDQLKPDVLVVDFAMPGLTGISVTEQVRRRYPKTRVVMLSMHRNEAYVQSALSKGANAYVLKESSAGDLVRAIREAIAGRRWLSPPLSESSLRAYTEKTKSGALDPYDTLTERERQVLHMAAEGLSSKEIAASLFISPRTVEIHRARVMHKLGLSSQTELVRFAIGHGIISVEHTRN